MNRRQLQKLGIPPVLVDAALDALGEAASQDLGFGLKGKRARELVRQVVVSPTAFVHDPIWGALAGALLGDEPTSREPIELGVPIRETTPDGGSAGASPSH
jgi:hypothetical protein